MAMKHKKDILGLLSTDLEHYFPDLKNHFMCPVCLKKMPIARIDSISTAHIIPKAAGGRLTTFLCSQCNSTFGSKQDKWFGELVRLLDDRKLSVLATKIKDGYFVIDGVKINGRWDIDSNGNFTFVIYSNLNSPEIRAKINDKFKSSPPRITISLSLPIMRKKRLIDVGFLTAGYLMWFSYLGYSWVLQSHLDIIREQILNPDQELIQANYLATCDALDCKPWVGFLPINNIVAPTFGIGPHITIIPPMNHPDIYSTMGTFTLNLSPSEIRAIKFPTKPHYEHPLGLMFEDEVLVLTDLIHDGSKSLPILQFTRQSNEAKILRFISEHEAMALEKAYKVIHKRIDLSHRGTTRNRSET
jgi:hypothetical protein